MRLALSGGAARRDRPRRRPGGAGRGRHPVRALAGTSAGAIVGALFAAGVPPDEIGRLALETRWSDLFRVRLPHAGMVSGEGLKRFFERVIPARTFAELRLPFAAVATDLATGLRVDCTSGTAGARGPGQLQPAGAPGAGVGGRPAARGRRGVQPAPGARRARNAGGDARSSPWTSTSAASSSRASNRWSTWRSTSRCSGPPARRSEEEAEADLVIGVDARGIALHDLSQGPELLRRGREAARAALPAIRALAGGRETVQPRRLTPVRAREGPGRVSQRRRPRQPSLTCLSGE